MKPNGKQALYRFIVAIAVVMVVAIGGWLWQVGERVSACEKKDIMIEKDLQYMKESLNRMMDKMGVQPPPKQGGKQ